MTDAKHFCISFYTTIYVYASVYKLSDFFSTLNYILKKKLEKNVFKKSTGLNARFGLVVVFFFFLMFHHICLKMGYLFYLL